MTVVGLFLVAQWGCLQFVSMVFPDHTHYFFSNVCHVNACTLSDNIGNLNKLGIFQKVGLLKERKWGLYLQNDSYLISDPSFTIKRASKFSFHRMV